MKPIDNIKSTYSRWTTIASNHLLYDRTLLWLFAIMLSIGFVMVSSASIPIGIKLHQDPFYFAKRDAIYIAISIIVCYFCLKIPMECWQRWQGYIFLIAVALLIIVLIPGIGKVVNGSRRWIGLAIVQFQPAEFAKLALICFLSGYFTRRYGEVVSQKWSGVKPFILLIIMGGLLLLQPDLGSTILLFVITLALLFIVGGNMFQFFFLIIAGAVLFIFLVLTSAYRIKRFIGFVDPFKDPNDTGYQLSNSLMAFGRGEFSGEGLGNSIQKLEYLPEAHTDFVMAVLGEEFGLIGTLLVILLLVMLVFRAMKIGKKALLLEQAFNGFFAFGISFWILLQGCINLGVTLGLFPTKGFTFPLVSYGGSSLIIMSISIAILLRIDHENRLISCGQARLKTQ